MRNSLLRSAFLAVCISTLASLTASAQTFTGGLRGSVNDAGGVLPGVSVTIINEGTQVERETTTNASGEYSFSAVPPATYTIRAGLTGFKTYERKGVRIATQQFLTLDITLEVGQVQETITVTADAPLIETSNASTGGTLDRQVLEALPAPGRNAFMISVTVPTVAPTGDPQFNRQQDQTNASRISMGGGGVRANNYLLDGVPITELRGRAVLNPTIEALEEVKVQVHTYDAEMGRTGGGVFNVTAKSGTNAFHGSGFYQTRPVWGVNENFFVEKTGQSKEESGLSEHLLPPVRRRVGRTDLEESDVFLDRDGRLSIQHDAQRAASLAQREAADRRFFDVHDRRRSRAHFQSVLSRRCGQRQVSGDGHRLARHGWRIYGRHHSADTPGGKRRRLRAAWRLAHADDRRRDCGQREQ